MNNIAVDIDGVLASFTAEFKQTVNLLWPNRLPEDYLPSDWYYSDKLTKAECTQALNATFSKYNLWSALEMLPGALELRNNLDKLYNNRINIYYATHRPEVPGPSSLCQTKFWLSMAHLSDYNTSVIIVGKAEYKIDIYKALNIQFSIDDKPETVEVCTAYHRAFLLDQPWNRGEKYQHLPRVSNVEEFLHIVLNISAGQAV